MYFTGKSDAKKQNNKSKNPKSKKAQTFTRAPNTDYCFIFSPRRLSSSGFICFPECVRVVWLIISPLVILLPYTVTQIEKRTSQARVSQLAASRSRRQADAVLISAAEA